MVMWPEKDFARPFGLQTCLRALTRIIYVVTDDPEGYAAGLTEWFKPRRTYLWVNDGEKRIEKQRYRRFEGLSTTPAGFVDVLNIDPLDGNHIELITNPAQWLANPEWVGMFALHTDSDDRRLQVLCFLGPETEIPVSLQPLVLRVGPPLDNPRYGADLFSETCVDALQAAYHDNTWWVKMVAEHVEKAQMPEAIYTDLAMILNKLKFVVPEEGVRKAAKALQGYSLFQVREIFAMAITLNKKLWKKGAKRPNQLWKKRAKDDFAGILTETIGAITQHYGWPS